MFKFKNASYITSAVSKKGWINDDLFEIAFLGRSNVGKSSLLNKLTNFRKLAKVSKTPGKTRMINFFSINNNKFRIVDTPGYGFSRISYNYKLKFLKMIKEYLIQRNNLKFVCLLVDFRNNPTKCDCEMYKFLKYFNILTIIIGTKLDKLKKNDIKKQEKIIKTKLNFVDNDFFLKLSVIKNINYDKLWILFSKILGFNN